MWCCSTAAIANKTNAKDKSLWTATLFKWSVTSYTILTLTRILKLPSRKLTRKSSWPGSSSLNSQIIFRLVVLLKLFVFLWTPLFKWVSSFELTYFLALFSVGSCVDVCIQILTSWRERYNHLIWLWFMYTRFELKRVYAPIFNFRLLFQSQRNMYELEHEQTVFWYHLHLLVLLVFDLFN